jgi:hypothetical protein
MHSYSSLSNESSFSIEASLACPLGSSEESILTNSKKVSLLDSSRPVKHPKSLLFSIFEEREGLKFKRMSQGLVRDLHGDDRSPTAVESHRRSVPKSSIFGVCANLVNSMLGGGIVGIPYAFKLSGFLTGLYLLILTSTLCGKLVLVFLQLSHASRIILLYIVSF